jgi:lysophospholipase L1-like esterase
VTPFARDAAMTTGLLAGLLLLERAHPSHKPGFAPSWLQAQVRDLAHHGPNEEDELGLLAGYYEDLLNASSAATKREDPEEGWRASAKLDETHEHVQGYLWYQVKPNLDLVTASGTRVVTNSHGLVDREYALDRPAGTRRIAFVGDSLVRGLGAPQGRALEPRFEVWLNATQPDAATRAYELLNFGVEGYRLTQLLDVALERTPAFHPDVVLLGLSDLAVSRNFGNHVARLVHEGVDLKYPFLRDLAERAGVKREDTIDLAESKLARVRTELLRDCLREVRDGLRAQGIALVAILLPTVTEPDRLEPRFAEARTLLAELTIPSLDLLGAIGEGDDLDALRVSKVDHHPNDAGYGRLLDRLIRELDAKPEAATLLLGHAARRGG